MRDIERLKNIINKEIRDISLEQYETLDDVIDNIMKNYIGRDSLVDYWIGPIDMVEKTIPIGLQYGEHMNTELITMYVHPKNRLQYNDRV